MMKNLKKKKEIKIYIEKISEMLPPQDFGMIRFSYENDFMNRAKYASKEIIILLENKEDYIFIDSVNRMTYYLNKKLLTLKRNF